ncbi:hypothetical protein GQ53DRAFT_738383 [Thozetella sp. PMI_491]|nr:hypothetical protein GQ53DRAFT_738383 [Thozetella sp. PMI_491]
MPPRLGLRPALVPGRNHSVLLPRGRASVCLFCSLSPRPLPSLRATKRRLAWPRRAQSTDASTPAPSTPLNTRKDLEDALIQLQKQAANYVNLSRVQLALRNLRQPPGDESIRVAILGMANGVNAGETAKKLSKLLLADPLSGGEDWERQLEDHDIAQPLVIRVGRESSHDSGPLKLAKDELLPEIQVSSPPLNEGKLELLVMEVNPLTDGVDEGIPALEESVLVPTVDIPTSNTGRFTPITTPVHKALLVGDGIRGAASVLSLPFLESKSTVTAAINFRQYNSEDTSDYPFITVDTDMAENGLILFRENISNAMKANHLLTESNIGTVKEWLKAGSMSNEEGTKEAVRNLVQSVLESTRAAITVAEARQLSSSLGAKVSSGAFVNLTQGVSDWAQTAHEELQEQLEAAFTGRRWRKLGWWKLFWRVDDVAMLSSEIVSQRFLPQAERGLVYLAGRIREAGVTTNKEGPVYPGPALPAPASDNGKARVQSTPKVEHKWPTHIPLTRSYILDTTIPALQALAQKLIAQSLGTSTVTTILGGLTYLSGFGLYEAGAVAGLGVVWSLRRLQKKWETAREYWHGEVREEGRKAVRASEASVLEVLDRATQGTADQAVEISELRRARDLVQRAEDALVRLK